VPLYAESAERRNSQVATMQSNAQSKPDSWSIGTKAFPAAKCLSTHHQAYLVRRDMILDQAAVVLGGRDSAEQWFNKPARGLDYQPPCSVVNDEHGCQRISEYLGRIEYGVY
jgi:putative toxin-antitoxin system antitoxin component (TIGR02293 family)